MEQLNTGSGNGYISSHWHIVGKFRFNILKDISIYENFHQISQIAGFKDQPWTNVFDNFHQIQPYDGAADYKSWLKTAKNNYKEIAQFDGTSRGAAD